MYLKARQVMHLFWYDIIWYIKSIQLADQANWIDVFFIVVN